MIPDEDHELKERICEYIKENKNDEPFYIINLENVKKQYDNWTIQLPYIKPYFAIKSNPDKKIIKMLADLGCNFDCASKNEIELVLNIINEPNRIIFANPCKSISHILYAKQQNVELMTFDSIEELEKIQKHYPEAKVILRICVDDSNSLCKFNSKFGCKRDDIDDFFLIIKKYKINFIGISFHVGSGCKSAETYYDAISDCKYIYTKALKNGINTIQIIDIGGGFPGNDNNNLFADICKNINNACKDYFNETPINFIAEPGRFFTESAYMLVVNVISKKKYSNVIKYYLNDGVYGSFNCIHYDHQKPELLPLKMHNNFLLYNSTFFGPTCDSMDVIYRDKPFIELNIGDWLYVKNFGSYTNAPSTSFNGFCVNDYKYIE